MSAYVLKKGTMVGHGTSLARLPSILEHGLLRGSERAEGRTLLELAPESAGVYVGELMAYFGAYAQYSAEVAPHLEDPAVIRGIMYFGMGDVRSVREIKLPPVPRTFPVVLKVRLGEDCELIADEDFVADGKYPVGDKVPDSMLRDEAQAIWERWGTGVLLRDIPPDWITSVEHPRVITLDNAQQAAKHVFADCELFAGAMMQSYKRDDRAMLVSQYVKRYGKLALSQRIEPTFEALERLLKLNGFADNANHFANHFMLFQTINMMAEKYEIPVARSLGDSVVLDRNGYGA